MTELSAQRVPGGGVGRQVTLESAPNREFIDVNADGNTYYGSAPFGSALADAVWTIERKNAAGTVFMFAPPNSVGTDPTALVYNDGVA